MTEEATLEDGSTVQAELYVWKVLQAFVSDQCHHFRTFAGVLCKSQNTSDIKSIDGSWVTVQEEGRDLLLQEDWDHEAFRENDMSSYLNMSREFLEELTASAGSLNGWRERDAS